MNPLPHPLRDAVLIALLALLAGLVINQRLLREAFSGQLSAPPPQVTDMAAPLPQPVLLAEVRVLLDNGALAVDARDGALHAEGHLPGAVSLPLDVAGDAMAAFRAAVPADRPLIVYCNGYGCPDSFDLGRLLSAAGYGDVRVFEGGFPEWRDAGLPVDKGRR